MNRRAIAALCSLVLAACRPSGEASPGPASASASQGAPPVAPALAPAPSPSAASEPAPDASQYAMVVHVGASAITAGGAPILTLGPRDELAQRGADARYKKSQNPNELFLVPLAEAAARARAADKAAHGAASSTALLVANPTTPYRLLIEVLFTLGQNEFGAWDLLADGEKRAPRRVVPPRAPTRTQAPPQSFLNATVLIVDGGFSIKTSGGNVAPGCNDAGAGLAIPKSSAGYDYDALAECLAKLKMAKPEWARETNVVVTGSGGADFATVMSVMDAIRTRHGQDLFPDVAFGIAR